MPRKCLMIELKDKRKFFTDKKNYNQLVEFSKAFDAEISVVRTDETPVDLVSLASRVCDDSIKVKKPSFEIIEVKVPCVKQLRSKLRHNAKIIRRWIRKELLDGKVVKLTELARRYKRYKLSLACFCNHLATVRDELEREGFKIEKIKRGEYTITIAKTSTTAECSF
jgi:hypothetical protein